MRRGVLTVFALNVTCHTAATVNVLKKKLYYRSETKKNQIMQLLFCHLHKFFMFPRFSIDFISIFSLDLSLLKLIPDSQECSCCKKCSSVFSDVVKTKTFNIQHLFPSGAITASRIRLKMPSALTHIHSWRTVTSHFTCFR